VRGGAQADLAVEVLDHAGDVVVELEVLGRDRVRAGRVRVAAGRDVAVAVLLGVGPEEEAAGDECEDGEDAGDAAADDGGDLPAGGSSSGGSCGLCGHVESKGVGGVIHTVPAVGAARAPDSRRPRGAVLLRRGGG
jgi:hypothetical protein